MFDRFPTFLSAASLALAVLAAAPAEAKVKSYTKSPDGIVRVESAYSIDETIARIKADLADKGIDFFMAIDQQKLSAENGIAILPSVQLIFGAAQLGGYFMREKQTAGLDWPVLMLVHQDKHGRVWAAYSDWSYIAKRHGISTLDKEFNMAGWVLNSVSSTFAKK